jgi:hypothetical protein
MWIIQEPKKVALRNKRKKKKKNGECAACLKYSVLIFVGNKYIKCNIWTVAVRPSHIEDARFLKVKRNNANSIQSILSPYVSRFSQYFYVTQNIVRMTYFYVTQNIVRMTYFYVTQNIVYNKRNSNKIAGIVIVNNKGFSSLKPKHGTGLVCLFVI